KSVTYLSLGPVVCPPQFVSPAVLYSRRPASSVWYPNLTGTHSHFRSDCPGNRKRKVSSLPPCSLLGHVTGPRRLQDHSRSAVLLAYAHQTGSGSGYLSNSVTCSPPLPKGANP
ncbi:unnamed protein product, partial [Staurois parvus]